MLLSAFAPVIADTIAPLMAVAKTDSQTQVASNNLRIISLSPHLTEIVFALEREKLLIAVSDYSDYPYPQGCTDQVCTNQLPSVASYQGADIAAIIRLQPTTVLVWEGGNKAQDIARLEQLGYQVFRSSPANIQELMAEIKELGVMLDANTKAQQVQSKMQTQLDRIVQNYAPFKASALYYMNQQPLSGMGNDDWLNSLLSLCGISNIYATLPTNYAQLSIADILRKQPQVIISASGQEESQVTDFWSAHANIYQPKIVSVNPDALHRFTPRVLPELKQLCGKVHF